MSETPYACPTECDPDCTVACHEVHQVFEKRTHDVEACIAAQVSEVNQRTLQGRTCWFCLEPVDMDNPENYRQVTSWVNGPKLDGPVMREQSGLVAHKKCIENLVNGQAPDQPELFEEDSNDTGSNS